MDERSLTTSGVWRAAVTALALAVMSGAVVNGTLPVVIGGVSLAAALLLAVWSVRLTIDPDTVEATVSVLGFKRRRSLLAPSTVQFGYNSTTHDVHIRHPELPTLTIRTPLLPSRGLATRFGQCLGANPDLAYDDYTAQRLADPDLLPAYI